MVAQTVKNLLAMQETWVQSLGPEDPLEKEIATHSSSLPRESHGQRSLAGYSQCGHKESDMTEQTHTRLGSFLSARGRSEGLATQRSSLSLALAQGTREAKVRLSSELQRSKD